MGGLLRSLIGGAIGGCIGIAIWVIVGYFAHYEIGWIAWGIGFLVGFGVRYAAFLGDQDEQPGAIKGVLASLMAVGSILVAKYLVFALLTGGIDRGVLQKLAGEMRLDDEAMVAGLANEIVEEMPTQGKTVTWPAGSTAETASKRGDYPADVWQQAEARWKQLGPQGQQQRKQDHAKVIAVLSDLAKEPDFSAVFSPMDALWFLLAVITAFRIGAGSYGHQE